MQAQRIFAADSWKFHLLSLWRMGPDTPLDDLCDAIAALQDALANQAVVMEVEQLQQRLQQQAKDAAVMLNMTAASPPRCRSPRSPRSRPPMGSRGNSPAPSSRHESFNAGSLSLSSSFASLNVPGQRREPLEGDRTYEIPDHWSTSRGCWSTSAGGGGGSFAEAPPGLRQRAGSGVGSITSEASAEFKVPPSSKAEGVADHPGDRPSGVWGHGTA